MCTLPNLTCLDKLEEGCLIFGTPCTCNFFLDYIILKSWRTFVQVFGTSCIHTFPELPCFKKLEEGLSSALLHSN